jgi:hypothetical protein
MSFNQPDKPGGVTIDVTPLDSPMYCYNHAQRETLLRCNRCERPICMDCSVKTPTGYRCKECVRSHQKKYETTRWIDFPLAIIVALVLSYAGSFITRYLGFFTIFLAPIAGIIIAEAIRWVTRRRRSIQLFRVSAVAAAVGSLPLLVLQLLAVIAMLASGSGMGSGSIFGIVWSGLYTILVTSSVYGRLSGINIR